MSSSKISSRDYVHKNLKISRPETMSRMKFNKKIQVQVEFQFKFKFKMFIISRVITLFILSISIGKKEMTPFLPFHITRSRQLHLLWTLHHSMLCQLRKKQVTEEVWKYFKLQYRNTLCVENTACVTRVFYIMICYVKSLKTTFLSL